MKKSPRFLMTKVESPGAAVRCLLWCNWIQASETELSSSRGHSDLGSWGGVFPEHPWGVHTGRLPWWPSAQSSTVQLIHYHLPPGSWAQRRGLMDVTPIVMWIAMSVSIVQKGRNNKGAHSKGLHRTSILNIIYIKFPQGAGIMTVGMAAEMRSSRTTTL